MSEHKCSYWCSNILSPMSLQWHKRFFFSNTFSFFLKAKCFISESLLHDHVCCSYVSLPIIFSQKSHTTCLIWERKPQWNLYQFLKQQIWHRLHFKDASQNFLCKVGTPLYSDLQAGWLSESSRNLKKNVTINYISIICTCMKKQGNLQLDMTRGGFQRNKKQHLQVPSTIWQEYKIRAAVY